MRESLETRGEGSSAEREPLPSLSTRYRETGRNEGASVGRPEHGKQSSLNKSTPEQSVMRSRACSVL